MVLSSMPASVLACLLFLFFLPCISMQCTPVLPCDQSIQIRPPFYYRPDTEANSDCQGNLEIGCNYNGPFLVWPSKKLKLERISYSSNNIWVQDPDLHSSLYDSNCGNLYFDFQRPVTGFNSEMYNSLNTGLSFVRCTPPNQIQSPPKVFGEDYYLNYSIIHDEDDGPLKNCLRPDPDDDSAAFFELVLSFKNDSREFSLMSASYSRDRLAQPGCFASSKEVFNKERNNRTRIIIGLVVASAFLLGFLGLLLLFYKQKKLRLASSSSNFLVQGETSGQYIHDLEVAGPGSTQIFSYAELEEATEGFCASKELGDGGFGTVYKGKLRDGRTVAVKRLYKNNYNSTEQFMNEVEILSHLHHPHLVTLYGCTARSSHEQILVYEYVPNGTVADHLHGPSSSKKLTWPVRLSIAIETANALAYLHAVEPPIIHRDVKTTNILLDGDFHVKVGDFGLSRLFPLHVTHVSTVPQGTPGYVDPVYHQCYHLTDKSDVYSFGVVLVELISSKQAVDLNRSKDEINLANMAVNKIQRSQLEELVDPNLGFGSNWEVRCMVSLVAELAFRCLQFDREIRPSIKEVFEALQGIERGCYNGDELVKENILKEESYLLKCDPSFSSDDMIISWKSSSTTPHTSA